MGIERIEVNKRLSEAVVHGDTVYLCGQVADDLKADVKTDGRVQVDGRGLLLAGGNNIGTNANQSVRATLLCANDGNVLHDTDLVPLEANGDFRIKDMLSPAPPDPCTSAVLLIRNPAGAWFAAGIPKLD